MNKEIKVTVKVETADLFRFNLSHELLKISGKVITLFLIISIILAPVSFFVWNDKFTAAAFLVIIIMYGVLTPFNWYANAARQVLNNPVFKNPIKFSINEERIKIKQYGGEVSLKWTQILKIQRMPMDYLFYINYDQAYIIPKKCMDKSEIIIMEELIKNKKDELAKEEI